MNRRLLYGAFGLAALLLMSGCLGIGTGPVPAEELDSAPDQSYAWNSTHDVDITVQENTQFRMVINATDRELRLFRRSIGGTNPLSVSAVRYQYPNGTIINGSTFQSRGGEVRQTREETVIGFPDSDSQPPGKIAFTSSGNRKRFSLPTYVDGSYQLTLPPNRRVEFPIFGSVSPGGSQKRIDEQNRLEITWESMDAETASARFYLQRDLYIFGGVLGGIILVGLGGLYRYRQRIHRLRKERQEMGLDIEADDE